MSVIWSDFPAISWNTELKSENDVRSLRAFLEEQGTFTFPGLSNGLFSAAAGEGDDFELTGYRNVWFRDNIHIAWAHLIVRQDSAEAANCLNALTEFWSRHRHRFVDIIEGRSDSNDPMNRPHIRFNGMDLTELPEKWSHAQNDALGYWLWLKCELISRDALDRVDWSLIALLIQFWNVVRVWEDEDSGHWEEVRKVAASSIGCALAGLTRLHVLMQRDEIAAALSAVPFPISSSDVQELMDHCRQSLQKILPAECIQSDALQYRRYDAALLFLIYPLDIVQDRAMEDQILQDVDSQLTGPYGIRRYPGDSYWCADYRDLLAADQRTADFSDNLESRDRLLKPGMEAQWCLFDPIVACIYGTRFLSSRDPADLDRMQSALGRSFRQLTRAGGRFPAYRCPESYFCEKGQWVPNDITPLLWTQGNLWQALFLLELCLDTQ
jgi:hypothetical protein